MAVNFDWQRYDDLMTRNAERGRALFLDLKARYQKAFDEFIRSARWTNAGNLMSDPENRVRLFTMRKKMLQAAKDFVDEVVIDDYSRQLFELGNENIHPDTFFAETGYHIGQVAREMYSGLAIDTRLIVANKLVSAADHITLHDGQEIGKVFKLLQSAINGGWNYEETQDALRQADFTANHAQTITRGVYSEIYQDHQNSIAETLGTEYFQLVGPPPLLGDDGHYFCQANYGRVLTKERWLEQAQIYSGVDAGLDPATLFVYGNGGYNCRHQLVAVAPQDIPEAREDEAEMKKTFDKFAKDYQ